MFHNNSEVVRLGIEYRLVLSEPNLCIWSVNPRTDSGHIFYMAAPEVLMMRGEEGAKLAKYGISVINAEMPHRAFHTITEAAVFMRLQNRLVKAASPFTRSWDEMRDKVAELLLMSDEDREACFDDTVAWLKV